MGVFLDKPKTEKETEHGSGNGMRFGIASMQGWRVNMEDAHCARIGLPNLPDWSFFSVFDGHAGKLVALHSSKTLITFVMENSEFKNAAIGKTCNVDAIRSGIRTAFLTLDEDMRNLRQIKSGEEGSGTTVSSLIISPEYFFFANCGDSRALLCRDGNVFFATTDHKPTLLSESTRINNAGGNVVLQRVNGSLAVSRALGDFEYKRNINLPDVSQLVSPEPDVTAIPRSPTSDEFIVIACDGIWDEFSNEELSNFVRSRLQLSDDLEQICCSTIDTSLHKGSRDNMSVIVITFPACPQPSKSAQDKEMFLEETLKSKIKLLINEDPVNTDLNHILKVLANEENLPPGGGIMAKRDFVRGILMELCPDSFQEDNDNYSNPQVDMITAQHLKNIVERINGPHMGEDGTDSSSNSV